MPCRDDGYEVDRDRKLTSEIAMLRSLLCEACNIADEEQMSGTLRKWWFAHKEEDARRRARVEEERRLRQISNDAMAKLTTEEVEALKFTRALSK